MSFRYVNIPAPSNSATEFGIIRWISKTTKTPNVNKSNLIIVTADSTRSDTSITAPISYPEENHRNHWVCGGNSNEDEAHWYQIDFLSFEVEISAFFMIDSVEHYFQKFYFKTSHDCVHFDEFEISFTEKPKQEYQIFKINYPKKARCVKIFTNSRRYDGRSTFAISRIDFFGKIRWFQESTRKTLTFLPRYSLFLTLFIFF